MYTNTTKILLLCIGYIGYVYSIYITYAYYIKGIYFTENNNKLII